MRSTASTYDFTELAWGRLDDRIKASCSDRTHLAVGDVLRRLAKDFQRLFGLGPLVRILQVHHVQIVELARSCWDGARRPLGWQNDHSAMLGHKTGGHTPLFASPANYTASRTSPPAEAAAGVTQPFCWSIRSSAQIIFRSCRNCDGLSWFLLGYQPLHMR